MKVTGDERDLPLFRCGKGIRQTKFPPNAPEEGSYMETFRIIIS